MLGKSKQTSKHQVVLTPAELIPWLEMVVEQPHVKLQVKLRGNIFHVLCESQTPLDKEYTLLRLVRSLMDADVKARFSQDFPQIYQVYFYSRQAQQARPDWSAPLYLNRLERHLEQLVAASDQVQEVQATAIELRQAQGIGQLDPAASAIVLSNISLARKGDPDAIARYLSETLSALDVGVDVQVRAVRGKARRRQQTIGANRPMEGPVSVAPGSELINRLWIFCEATYSPDPALLAQPTAQRLRDLKLTQFQDAVIVLQVLGEESADWQLRVDLTPATEMLKEWARWGDQEALSRLLNRALKPLAASVTTEIKDSTLHLVCQALGSKTSLQKDQVVSAIAALLDQIGPQGIHRAMVYGDSTAAIAGTGTAHPAWLSCLDLPATESAALAPITEQLARQGDLPAIAYCLTRALNPDLDQQLATGGIRVQLLIKQQRLHIMVDGPVCPPRPQVAPIINRYLRQQPPKGLEGIRIYGRRAGQKQPAWNDGFDFKARPRLVPQATPAFAASDLYFGDLLTASDESGLRTTVTQADVAIAFQTVWQQVLDIVRQILLQTQFFAIADDTPPVMAEPFAPAFNLASKQVAIVWGILGLFLTLQIDWVIGEIFQPPATSSAAVAQDQGPDKADRSKPLSAFEEELAALNWGTAEDTTASQPDEISEFPASPPDTALATSAINDSDLIGSPDQAFVSTASLLATSPYPTFGSQQVDEKLALYDRHLTTEQSPDVLILGSSRALRGIDPVALQQALASMGYKDVKVFNFGINGSTAQVVDLVIRQLLALYPQPKLILWADGARAFNSGRQDVTYDSIVGSEGYQQLLAGTLVPAVTPSPEDARDATNLDLPDPEWDTLTEQINSYYQQADRRLSRFLGDVSATYESREQFKTLLQQGAAWAFTQVRAPQPLPVEGDQDELTIATLETDLIDFDGFLSLSVRFNPSTYYQKHVRVPGNYDSDYHAFTLEGVQTEALEKVIEFTQSRHIPLVFVNTPLTDEYLDPARSEAEKLFQRYMVALSTQKPGFFYRDLGQLWPNQYDYFSDPSHLNRYGAYQVSNRLAQDPIIPWADLKPAEINIDQQ